MTDGLAIKRVAGRPGDHVPFAGGRLWLGDDEAWLLGDASDEDALARGDGRPVDSRRFGPVSVDRLLGRVWLRYAPVRRFGRIAAGPAIDVLLQRGVSAAGPPPTAYGSGEVDAAVAEALGRERGGG